MLLKDRDCLVFGHEILLILVDLLIVDRIGKKQHLKIARLNFFVNFLLSGTS